LIVLISLSILLICFFANIPIATSLIFSSLIYFVLAGDAPLVILAQRMVAATEKIPLLAIPFFVTLGTLMTYSGISKRMMAFADTLTGHMPGGLAQVNVLLSTLMGGLSASSNADAAMDCKMLVPEMERYGYSKAFSVAVTAASAQITPIIPPGIALIIYGFIANVSIAKMFMAGIIPGIMMCVGEMVMVNIISKKRGYLPHRQSRATFREIWNEFKKAFWALSLMIIVIGGIRMGIFTPTEAGSIAIIYILIVSIFVYKEFKIIQLKNVLLESARATGTVMIIVMAAAGFAWIITWEGVASVITGIVTTLSTNPVVYIAIINVFLLIVGMFLEGSTALIVLIPLLVPTASALGIDLVHFGIVIILNLAIGTLTPPMGTILFLTCGLTGAKVDEVVRELIPFYAVLLSVLLMISFIPEIVLFLPNLLK